MKEIIDFGLYLTIPTIFVCGFFIWKNKSKMLAITILCISLLGFWASFVEPYQIKVEKINIPLGINKTIIFVSDHHLGTRKQQNFSKQIADIVNKTDGDFVLHGGDFASKLAIGDMDRQFGPLREINKPQYGVLGNHDFIYAKSIAKFTNNTAYSQKMVESLEKNGVNMLLDEEVDFGDFRLIGLSSRQHNSDEVEKAKLYNNSSKPTITLSHEPFMAMLLPSGKNLLTMSGHTHCGQIKIPYIWEEVIPRDNEYGEMDKFSQGIYQTPSNGQVFVGCGVGETGVPLRLFNPPTIYQIDLK